MSTTLQRGTSDAKVFNLAQLKISKAGGSRRVSELDIYQAVSQKFPLICMLLSLCLVVLVISYEFTFTYMYPVFLVL